MGAFYIDIRFMTIIFYMKSAYFSLWLIISYIDKEKLVHSIKILVISHILELHFLKLYNHINTLSNLLIFYWKPFYLIKINHSLYATYYFDIVPENISSQISCRPFSYADHRQWSMLGDSLLTFSFWTFLPSAHSVSHLSTHNKTYRAQQYTDMCTYKL